MARGKGAGARSKQAKRAWETRRRTTPQGRGRLVCQRLENVSRKALEDYRDIISDDVKGKHGVYALYRKSRLYYVGLASNLKSRLTHHLKDRHQGTWDRFSVYLTSSDRHLRELESLLVRIATPRGNRQTGQFLRCEDLRPSFRKRMRQRMTEVIDGLLPDGGTRRPEPRRRRKKIARKPVLAAYITSGFPVRFDYKGKRYRARVLADGTIKYAGKVFTSPSSSAASAMARGAADGWFAWHYERTPGEWVPLDELRRGGKPANK